jgi:hypothetical protein
MGEAIVALCYVLVLVGMCRERRWLVLTPARQEAERMRSSSLLLRH